MMNKQKNNIGSWQTVLVVGLLMGVTLYLYFSYYYGNMSMMKAVAFFITAAIIMLLLIPKINNRPD